MMPLHPAIQDWEKHLKTCQKCPAALKDMKTFQKQACPAGKELYKKLPTSTFGA